MTALAPTGMLDFELPPEREAHEPPEARGVRRDDVRLLVSPGLDDPVHARFSDLPSFLEPGDLLVVNTSGTIPAALDARLPDGTDVELHLSSRMPASLWAVELRRPALPASRPWWGAAAGATLNLPGGGRADVLAHYPGSARLWVAALRLPEPFLDYLSKHGRPIRYRHVERDWPLDAYQTVYATDPGSAEMPSAGRAFSPEIVTALVARGVAVTPLLLHTGVSSLEEGEAPYAEWYRVPKETAVRVNATRAAGGRVVAVGTTVVRALETTAGVDGAVTPSEGWTELVVTPERGVRAVGGLLTGWHEPRASHLLLLEAVAGRPLLESAYRAALDAGYLWHEFGDLHLILPTTGSP
jgi:S-adenosylmethionine:tRNA ribosyltransferase-isomerase